MFRFVIMLLFMAATLSLSSATFVDTAIVSRADSLSLSVLIAEPEHTPRGVIQIVHGMCEYKERYIPFMNFLADNGFAVVIHDHRGHGASVRDTTELGYFGDVGYSAMIDDARQVGEMIRRRYPDRKFMLFGHSMGSMVVRGYVKRADAGIEALVVCGSPSYNPASGIGACLARNAAKAKGPKSRPASIQKMSFGSFNRRFKDEGSPNAWICSDTAVVRAYDADPRCNFRFTANGFYNLFQLMRYSYDTKGWTLSNPAMPILFVAGEDDPCIVSPAKFAKAQAAMRKAGYTDVSGTLYPHMRHEILNERDKLTVWRDLLVFFESCLK